jgi:choline-sulfatase
MTTKPLNVIVITSDEMRGDCPSFMGNPDCKTPFLDDFASKSVVFENHFANHGKCLPSRVGMLTGRYSHTDGFRTVNVENLLPETDPCFVKKLRIEGYETAIFGHNHMWENFWGDDSKPSSIADYHSFCNDEYKEILNKEWPTVLDGECESLNLSNHKLDYEGKITGLRKGFIDDNKIEQAIHYLKDGRDREKSFYLHLVIGLPHPPYKVEEPYFSMYNRDEITPWTHELPSNAPLNMQMMRKYRTDEEISDEAYKEIQAVYYGMITKVDAMCGRLLKVIEEEGLMENSIILFWVDHGDFAGQYGLVEKWDTSMNDCILHVPLLLYAPGLPQGKRITSLTEHVDIAPTMLDILNIKQDWGIHGESLLPIIDGKTEKDAVYADGGHEDEMHHRFSFDKKTPSNYANKPLNAKQVTYRECPDSMARTSMVRTNEWKMIIRLRGGNELYNILKDPYEMNNLWGKPAYNSIVMELQQKMIEWNLRTYTDRPRQDLVGA